MPYFWHWSLEFKNLHTFFHHFCKPLHSKIKFRNLMFALEANSTTSYIIALFVLMNISFYWALHFYISFYDAVCLFGKSKRYNFFLSLLFCAEHRLFWNLTPTLIIYYIGYIAQNTSFLGRHSINAWPSSYFDNLISSALLRLQSSLGYHDFS